MVNVHRIGVLNYVGLNYAEEDPGTANNLFSVLGRRDVPPLNPSIERGAGLETCKSRSLHGRRSWQENRKKATFVLAIGHRTQQRST